jgi:cbb3-type cytochrome oxidase maturation protein
MYWSTILVWTVVGILVIAWGVLMLWGRRSGQFSDIEEAKYLMLEEDREPDER